MIRAEGLTKYYENRCVVDGLSFSIEEREIVGFLGLNGAGKTTSLRMLAGLLMPSSGRIEIDGHDLLDDPLSVRWRIGFLPETPPIYEDMGVFDFLGFAARLRGFDPDGVDRRVDEVLELCDLGEVAAQRIGTLSHGYRQRVGIAQAVVHDPQLVILDEPINGLDPAQIFEMRSLIKTLKERHTVLLSSHILSEISQTCDRILILRDGALVGQGSEAELFQKLGASRRRFGLEVRGERSRIEQILTSLEIVQAVDVLFAEEGRCEIELHLSRDEPERVVAALVAGEVGVRRLEAIESELEAMFLKLTGVSG